MVFYCTVHGQMGMGLSWRQTRQVSLGLTVSLRMAVLDGILLYSPWLVGNGTELADLDGILL